jgi:hypothetical protein
MKALLFLFSGSDEAGSQALALSQAGWNVVVTGPNDSTEVRQEDEFVANLAAGWTVLASRQSLQEP